jgi:hypothetical protein
VKTVMIGPRIRQIRYQLNVRETRLRDQLVIDFFEREGGGPLEAAGGRRSVPPEDARGR